MNSPAATLNELIELTRDGMHFYTDAIPKVTNPHLKIVFRAMIDAKHRLITALSEHVRVRGEAPSRDGTLAGGVRKVYADLRARIGDAQDAVYVGQLEASEERLLAAFERAAAEASDPQVREIILANLPKVRLCHEQMRNLKMELAA
jgi:uncharacterized protein (TIGR02284 family)